MDKERKAFKAWFKKEYLGIDALANQGDEGARARRSYAYVGWQAAKAQAIPDGYKVVPKEPTQEMLDAFPEVEYEDTYAGVCSMLIDNQTLKIGYKAMIEAQEDKG